MTTLTTNADRFVRDRFTWLAYLMLAYYAYLEAVLGPLMPFLRAELDLDYTTAGFHFSAFALGLVAAGLTGDRFAARWGRGRLFWTGGIGMAVGGLLLIVGQLVAITIAAALIMGYLGALLLVVIQASLSDRHQGKRAIALTESNVAASISAGLGPLLIGLFQGSGLSWRAAIVSALIVFLVVALIFRHEPIPAVPKDDESQRNGRTPLPRSFWIFLAVLFLSVSAEWSLVFWGADFLNNTVGLSRTTAATLMSVFFLAMVLGRLTGSRLTRKIPSGSLLIAALATALAGFLVFWLTRWPFLNVAGLFVAGFGIANLYPLTLSVITSIVPTRADLASARVSLSSGLAILTAPLALGWMADRVGIASAFGSVVIIIGLGLGLTFAANHMGDGHQTALE